MDPRVTALGEVTTNPVSVRLLRPAIEPEWARMFFTHWEPRNKKRY